MRRLVLMAVLLIAIIGVAPLGYRALAQPGDGVTRIFLPLAFRPATTLPLPPPDEAAQRLTLPPGFQIRIFAPTLSGRPRFMAFGPDGHLYISLMSAGQIARLPDRNRDGVSDGVEIVASGLSQPHGLEWHDGWLYVAEGDKIERLHDSNRNGSLETKELVTANIPGPVYHISRTVHFGPDGKLYVSAGSSCNFCTESDKRRATIMRFNPDGSIPADNPFARDPDPNRRPVWAEGLRNSVDFLWTPVGELWADHNGSDQFKLPDGSNDDDTPPEEIVINVERGKHYGWPYCYTPTVGVTPAGTKEVRDSRVPLPPGFTCDQAVPALFTDKAHSAPLGMTLGANGSFPSGYADDLYVAYHGSWNTDTPASFRDCKVQRIEVENGRPVRSVDFVNGWRAPGQACRESATWGRPADVIFGPDGAMYISDDHAGRVYRVVYTGR